MPLPIPLRPLAAFTAAAAFIIPPPVSAHADSSVERQTLPSGMRVIVAPRPNTGLVAFTLLVRAGSGSETPETSGTAHFVEHLVFKGTTTRAPGDIDKAIESLGGELTAQTTRDATRYTMTLPAAGWQDALGVLADMMQHPAFRDDDVTAEKRVILAEMAIGRTEPMRAGFGALVPALFAANEPYHLALMGPTENVQHMTPDALRAFWSRWYRPEDMTLAVAGDVAASDIFAAVTRLFPGAPTMTPSTTPPAPTPPAKPADPPTGIVRVPADPDGPQRSLVTVMLGFRAPAARADDTDAVTALISLLANNADTASDSGGRLAEALIGKKKLALTVSADYVAQRDAGMIVIAATGRREDAAKLEAALRDELTNLSKADFSEDDALQGRQAVTTAQSAGDATVGGQADRLAQDDLLGVPPEQADDPGKSTAHISEEVTPATLAAAAKRYLIPDQGAVVLIGNAPQ